MKVKNRNIGLMVAGMLCILLGFGLLFQSENFYFELSENNNPVSTTLSIENETNEEEEIFSEPSIIASVFIKYEFQYNLIFSAFSQIAHPFWQPPKLYSC